MSSDARIVDHDVERPELVLRGREQGLDRLWVQDVGRLYERLPAVSEDFVPDRLQPLNRPTREDHPGPLAGALPSNLRAQPPAGTSHHHDLAGHSAIMSDI